VKQRLPDADLSTDGSASFLSIHAQTQRQTYVYLWTWNQLIKVVNWTYTMNASCKLQFSLLSQPEVSAVQPLTKMCDGACTCNSRCSIPVDADTQICGCQNVRVYTSLRWDISKA